MDESTEAGTPDPGKPTEYIGTYGPPVFAFLTLTTMTGELFGQLETLGWQVLSFLALFVSAGSLFRLRYAKQQGKFGVVARFPNPQYRVPKYFAATATLVSGAASSIALFTLIRGEPFPTIDLLIENSSDVPVAVDSFAPCSVLVQESGIPIASERTVLRLAYADAEEGRDIDIDPRSAAKVIATFENPESLKSS